LLKRAFRWRDSIETIDKVAVAFYSFNRISNEEGIETNKVI
jgi:hypothetical protein